MWMNIDDCADVHRWMCICGCMCTIISHTHMLGETCIMSRAEVLCFGGCWFSNVSFARPNPTTIWFVWSETASWHFSQWNCWNLQIAELEQELNEHSLVIKAVKACAVHQDKPKSILPSMIFYIYIHTYVCVFLQMALPASPFNRPGPPPMLEVRQSQWSYGSLKYFRFSQ